MNQKGFGLIGIIIVIAVIAALGGGSFYFREMQQQQSLIQIGKEKEQEALRLKEQIEKRFEHISPSSSPVPSVSPSRAPTLQNTDPVKDILEKTRQLLISLDKLSRTSTLDDAKNYVLPPLHDRPLIYYCGGSFTLQYVGGEYHKLEFYSSQTLRKTSECEATFEIGGSQPYPPSCSVKNSCVQVSEIPQMFESAKTFVKAHSVVGMEFDLEVTKRIGNWVVFRIIPTNVDTDNAQLFMEYVNGKWELRAGPGTAFPDLWEEHPELFK